MTKEKPKEATPEEMKLHSVNLLRSLADALEGREFVTSTYEYTRKISPRYAIDVAPAMTVGPPVGFWDEGFKLVLDITLKPKAV